MTDQNVDLNALRDGAYIQQGDDRLVKAANGRWYFPGGVYGFVSADIRPPFTVLWAPGQRNLLGDVDRLNAALDAAHSDTHVVNEIALHLGTADEWSGADDLEVIADLIGTVRLHPGNDTDPDTYEARMHGEEPT